MWKKGSGKGYYNGAQVWDLKDSHSVNPSFKSRARRFPDGRTEICCNLYTPFPTNPDKSRKRLSDLFRSRFGFAPRICVVLSGNRSRGSNDYLTYVSWYAVFKEQPDLTGFQEEAESVLVELQFKRYGPDGSVEVYRYDELKKNTVYQIRAACDKQGYYSAGKVLWRFA